MQQLVVGERAPVGERDLPSRAVDARRRRRRRISLALGLGVEGVGLQEQPVALHRAHEIGLGQRRPLIGRERLVADHGDGAREALGAKGRDGLRARLARADDDDALGMPERRLSMPPGRRAQTCRVETGRGDRYNGRR